MVIVLLLMVIICILLFGAAAVRGAFGGALALVAAGLAIVPLLASGEQLLGRDADLFIGLGIIVLSLTIWVATKLHDPQKAEIRRRIRRRDAEKALRELNEASRIRSEEQRLRQVREAHESVYGNPIVLSKADRKRRREASRMRGPDSLKES
jgi:hypothetical protein